MSKGNKEQVGHELLGLSCLNILRRALVKKKFTVSYFLNGFWLD